MVHRGRHSSSFPIGSSQSSTKPPSLSTVLFANAKNKGFVASYLSLFKGIQFALIYKISQRSYQFTGQPVISHYISKHYLSVFNDLFGKKHANTAMQASAGLLIGLGEIVFLPLDALKVKSQTSTAVTMDAGRGAASPWQLLTNRGTLKELYRGGTWTACRNSLGCFSLFGVSALVKDTFFNDERMGKNHRATFLQTLAGSLAGMSHFSVTWIQYR